MTEDTFNSSDSREKPLVENRIVPIMREAVATVQLVLFARLKEQYARQQHPDINRAEASQLAAAVVNDLFGVVPQEPSARAYARKNLLKVEEELRSLTHVFAGLLGIITDALRMQTLCDKQEGQNSLPTLLRARALGILQEERNLPLPSTFMLAVRALGVEQGVIAKMEVSEEEGA